MILPISVPVLALGDGPAVDVSALVGQKTVQLSGSFAGKYVVLASQDDVDFVVVAMFEGGGEFEQTVSGAFKSFRVRSLAQPTGPVTCEVSGVEGLAQNFFATVAVLTAGQSGYTVPLDTWGLFPPTGLEEDVCFICRGSFVGPLVVEGSIDGVGWDPLGTFTSASRSLSEPPVVLDFQPLLTEDKIRYVRVRVVMAATGPVVVTLGGRIPPSSGSSVDPVARAMAAAAQATANTALANAATAQGTANSSQVTANTALTNANAAQVTANTALANAATAQGTANTALTNANAALALTLAEVYANGAVAADQTLALLDAKGGALVVDGTAVGFTGAYALVSKGNLQVNGVYSLAVGVATPTARIHAAAGTATAGTAPLKVPSGVVLTVPEPGALEADNNHLYWTNSASVRLQLDDAAATTTLAQAYANGAVAADQTLALLDAKGGALVVDGTAAGFTGAYALVSKGNLQVNGVYSLAVGVATPTARIHAAAGTATAGTAPLKIPSGVVLTVPEPGALEADNNHLYWTNSSGTRLQLDDAPPSAQTLAATYGSGAIAADQTLALLDANGGGIIVDGTAGGFTGANALQIKSVASGLVNFPRSGGLAVVGGSPTGLTAGTENIDANFNLSATKTWATGAIATQRDFLIQARTYAFAGGSVVTTGATLAVTGPPSAGANATITNPITFWVQSGVAEFSGNVGVGVLQPTARLHLAAVTTTAGTSSLKIIAGTVMTIAEQGAVENDGTHLWWTDSTSTRRQLDNAAIATTLAANYAAGSVAADQTLALLDTKGGGLVVDGTNVGFTGTNALAVNGTASSTVLFPRLGGLTITQGIVNTGVPLAFSVTGGAHTAITLSTEDVGANFNFSATKQWATGALATQREVVFQAPTYAFVGASVITNAATLAITGAPTVGTNATIRNNYALWVQGGLTKLDAGNTKVAGAFNSGGLITTATNASSAAGGGDWSGIATYYTVNQTGGATGSSYGLLVVATETSVIGPHFPAFFYNSTVGAFICSLDAYGGLTVHQYQNQYPNNPQPAFVVVLSEDLTAGTAGTEISSVRLDFGATKTWQTGALITQREFLITPPTYAFAGASTLTTAATVAIAGAPAKGANATLTNTSALLLQGTYTLTTGSTTINELAVVATFNSSASTAAFCATNLRYTINQTGTSSGTIHGILVNATETAVRGTHNLLNLQIAAVSRFTVDRFGNTTIAQVAEAALVPTALTVTGGAHTNITLSTEDVGVNLNLSATKQWATGALTVQREILMQAPTYAFVGGSTITTAVTLDITGAPVAGANATITNSYALRVEAGSSQFVPTKTVVAAAGSVWHGLDMAAATLTVTGATTPVTSLTFLNVGQPTITAASAVVTTDFYTVRIAAATFAGAGPASATRNWSLAVDGNTRLGGGQAVHGTDVNVAGPYTVLETDYALEIRRTATAAISINLPPISGMTAGNPRVLVFVDSGYNAAVNNITLVRNGADTINNVAGNYVQNVPGSSIWLKANTTTNNWEII